MPTDNYLDIIKHIPQDSTILDLGCGCGLPFKDTKYKRLVGIDIFEKTFSMPEYDEVLYEDALNIDEVFKKNSFDVVIGVDFIEHLRKEDGFKIMKKAEKIASKKVIFFTPKDWSDNKEAVENQKYWSYGNQSNYHKSLWTEEDFTKKGYKPLIYQGYVLVEKEVGK